MPSEIKKIEKVQSIFCCFAFGTHDDKSGLYKKVHKTRNDKNRLP